SRPRAPSRVGSNPRRRRRRCSRTSATRSTSWSTAGRRRGASPPPSSTRPWTRHASCARARCRCDPVRVTGVIQAGGKSTRMGGRPKALLELGGRWIIERVVDAVKPAVDELLIVTNTAEVYALLELLLVVVVLHDHGLIGGLY